MNNKISGNIVDIKKEDIYPGTIEFDNKKIIDIKEEKKDYKNYITPGFIDSHIHIESSMLTPSEFSRTAVIHGTIGVVTDPHEIANVLGIKGINYMINNAKTTPLKFYFGAPSCVPASPFETTGYTLNNEDIEKLLKRDDIYFLAEMMNYPGVINNDPNVIKKIKAAQNYCKPVDGHAPGLRGKDLKKYSKAGISTDHECFTIEEAEEKIKQGMKILIREGSAAKNFDELFPLIKDNYKDCMFCSDDKHPDDLIKGHINILVKKAIKQGIDPLKVLTVACLNPVDHYNLDIGLLKVGDPADFMSINNFEELKILKNYINGSLVSEKKVSYIKKVEPDIINNFNTKMKKPGDFKIKPCNKKMNVIEAIDGQLITKKTKKMPVISDDNIISDPNEDVLKISVVNRYKDVKPSIGFIKNFGLKKGAIASSVAHDSHNIISVGVNDKEICNAVNLIIENKGGICAVWENKKVILPLPIAGIISNESYSRVAKKYTELNDFVKKIGCELDSPFMTLSFMGLSVIPEIKLSDKGLFDSQEFRFIDLCE